MTDTNSRVHAIDIARGIAIAAMIIYHFGFDLDYFGWIVVDINHSPYWLTARTAIVSLFLLIVGISLQLAHGKGIRWPVVAQRFAVLGAAALAVTLATALLFPDSYVFFGILHFIALASVAGLPFLNRPLPAVFSGAALLLLGNNVSHRIFDSAPLQWIGLMTHKPITEDYVPLLPWLGVVLFGIAAGTQLRRVRQQRAPRGASGVLSWMGRHSLAIYLLHQPVLMAILYLATALVRS